MHPSEELWISRAIDRRASEQDWQQLETIAADDHDVWRRLASTLRAEGSLVQHVEQVMPGADDAPPLAAARSPRWFAAAAAMLVIGAAFAIGRFSATGSRSVEQVVERAGGSGAAMGTSSAIAGTEVASADLDGLLGNYLDAGTAAGRVLEQLPLQIVASRRTGAGPGFEVVFVRSFVERTEVEHAMTIGPDEHGRPTPLAVDLARYVPPANY